MRSDMSASESLSKNHGLTVHPQAKTAEKTRNPVPSITYPEELPVSAKRDDIAQAIKNHQVIVVCGETGSGKTTQLPKICLELGRGQNG